MLKSRHQTIHSISKKIIGFIMVISVIVTMAGCEATSVPEANTNPVSLSEETTETENIETVPGSEENATETEEVKRQTVEQDENGYPYLSEEVDEEYQADLFKAGNRYLDYKVERTGTVKSLRAETAVLKHDTSGATVYLIRNDDKELAFDISYRVPQLNNADIPHVFEHSIITGSDKYPATDLTFDMVNTTYNTFVNAMTSYTCTSYPFSTMSQGQFVKLMDAYMSCMAAPKVLENENIFKREAVRYQLYDINDPITLTGVVFSEDMGFLTEGEFIESEAVNDSLYPDTIMGNTVGKCYTDLEDLTFSNMTKVYDAYYRFDNALILLYGDMDYKAVLEYLDREYLSKYPKKGEPVKIPEITIPEGYEETEYDIPAYEDDTSGSQNTITYAFDLSGFTEEEVSELNIFTDLMMNSSSSFMRRLREEGLQWNVGMEVDPSGWYPTYKTILDTQGRDIDKKVIKEAFDESLEEIINSGFSKEIYDVAIKEREIDDAFRRENVTIIVSLIEAAAIPWSRTGNPMVMETDEEVFNEFLHDSSQNKVKELAQKLKKTDRRVLVCCKEKPGLAEEIDREIENYLKELKENMTESELLEMIETTKKFDEWNEEYVSNKNVAIKASELPEPVRYVVPEITDINECTVASVPIEREGICDVGFFFDTSVLKQEELYDFVLYMNLLGNTSTTERTQEDFDRERALNGSIHKDLTGEDFKQPYDRMYLKISLRGFTEDFGNNLNLMEEMLTKSVYKKEEVQEIAELLRNDYEPGNIEPDTAVGTMAEVLMGAGTGFEYYVMRGMQKYLEDIETSLAEDEAAIDVLAERMENIRNKIWHRDHMLMSIAASSDDIAAIKDEAKKLIERIPSGVGEDYRETYDYDIPEGKRTGLIVNSPMQYLCGGLVLDNDDFRGRYLPFFEAIRDRYIIPEMRYKNGAYGADIDYSIAQNMVVVSTYKDPNCRLTLEVIDGIPSALREMDLTEEDLQTYTVSVYKKKAIPMGELSHANSSINAYLLGHEPDYVVNCCNDVKKTTPEEKNSAADVLDKVVRGGYYVMAGSNSKLEEDKDCFDRLLVFGE